MKKNILIITVTLSFMVLFGTAFVISQSLPQETKSKKSGVNQKIEKSCCTHEMKSEEISENSVFLLESEWKNENNKKVNLASLKGTNYVISMIFTSCTYACPVIVNDMKKVEEKLSGKDFKDIKFLLVSIDPERDTPKALLEFANRYNLDLNKWQLLTSNESNVSELAAVLGFKYKRENDGSYSHSNIISILNKEGEVAYQHFGLNKDVGDIIETVKSIN